MSAQRSSLGLLGIALLEGLPADRLDTLARECAWRSYRAGQRIVLRAEMDRNLYLVVSGRVRVHLYAASGREVTFRDIDAGSHFGEVSAIDGMARSADVVGLEGGLLAVLPQPLLQRLLREAPAVAERLLRDLARLVRRLTDRVVDLSTMGVHDRLSAELLRLARKAGVRANRARIAPAPKHTELASRVSTCREQVTRELSAMARAGVLAREGGALVVLDAARLEKALGEVRASG